MMTISAHTSALSLIYDGGIAESGQLHFYEYSRAVYAFSRLIQTVEYYRERGVVPQKIVGHANKDLIIKSSKRGSFIVDIAIASSQIVPYIKALPFSALYTYLLEYISDKSKKSDAGIAQVADLVIEIEKQRTLQSSEETKRLRAVAEIVAEQQATQRQILDFVGGAMTLRSLPASDKAVLEDTRERLEMAQDRQALIRQYERHLAKIPEEDMVALSTKARPILSEIALPLRKSATEFSLAAGRSRDKVAKLDQSDVDSLNSRTVDIERMNILGKMKAYDRENGYGKFREAGTSKVYPFSVPLEKRRMLAEKVSAALTMHEIEISVFAVRNLDESITSLILDDIDQDT